MFLFTSTHIPLVRTNPKVHLQVRALGMYLGGRGKTWILVSNPSSCHKLFCWIPNIYFLPFALQQTCIHIPRKLPKVPHSHYVSWKSRIFQWCRVVSVRGKTGDIWWSLTHSSSEILLVIQVRSSLTHFTVLALILLSGRNSFVLCCLWPWLCPLRVSLVHYLSWSHLKWVVRSKPSLVAV